MRRREFVAGFASVAATWPLAARAQKAVPIVGSLSSESNDGVFSEIFMAFRRGLSETGYVEGRNLAFEYRWADSHYDRLPALAGELVRRQVALIATGGTPKTLAAKAATTTIPIVFFQGADPVRAGLVASLARPGGNLTGITNLAAGLEAKRLQMLHELVPAATSVAMLVNPDNPATAGEVEARTAAQTLGINLLVFKARNEDEIATAFASLVEQRAGALLVKPDSFFIRQADQLVALAARYGIPASYEFRLFTAAGGLMSYGTDFNDAWRQVGIYAGRILKGEKPANLPVQQPVKFEMVLNMKTAKALGLTVPALTVLRADEVIE